jgi:RNA polymerase sigma factor (sigma-70 family)
MVRRIETAGLQASPQGEDPAFEHFVAEFRPVMLAVARKHLRNHVDAEEAAQDALVRLHRIRTRFRADTSPEGLVVRVVTNACRDLHRRRTAGIGAITQRMETSVVRELAVRDGTDGTGDRLVARELLAGLSERFRVPLELRYLEGLTNAEIASRLGISVSSVKLQLARAIELLQQRMDGTAHEG